MALLLSETGLLTAPHKFADHTKVHSRNASAPALEKTTKGEPDYSVLLQRSSCETDDSQAE